MCGSGLEPDSRFCPNCGGDLIDIVPPKEVNNTPPPVKNVHSTPKPVQKTPSYSQKQYSQNQYYKSSDTEGTIALIFGIIGFCCFPILGSIVAIILGSISNSKNRESSTGKIGIVLGIIGILCWIVFFVSIFIFIAEMMSSYPPYYY